MKSAGNINLRCKRESDRARGGWTDRRGGENPSRWRMCTWFECVARGGAWLIVLLLLRTLFLLPPGPLSIYPLSVYAAAHTFYSAPLGPAGGGLNNCFIDEFSHTTGKREPYRCTLGWRCGGCKLQWNVFVVLHKCDMTLIWRTH